MDGTHISHVGICALDVYFPSLYVDQQELERFDGISSGKYTLGLGQNEMAFVQENEDAVSMALTATQSLLDKYEIDVQDIGRIDVATETPVDKSKSIKSHLMQLFFERAKKNTKPKFVGNVEGCDTIHACYGGTNALFNSVYYVQSQVTTKMTSKKYGLVVATDISMYQENSNAKSTGGAGAIAMLIGENAPLTFHILNMNYSETIRMWKSSYSEHGYDFYKPVCKQEPFPIVDGHTSTYCYLKCLDQCYDELRYEIFPQDDIDVGNMLFDYCLFHAPFNKLVQKAYALLILKDLEMHVKCEQGEAWIDDFLTKYECHKSTQSDHIVYDFAPQTTYEQQQTEKDFRQLVQRIKSKKESVLDMFYNNPSVQRIMLYISQYMYDKKVEPSCLLPRSVGNSYTASLYMGLCSLVDHLGDKLHKKRMLMYSYGSGFCSSMFVLQGRQPLFRSNQERYFTLNEVQDKLNLKERLSHRLKCTPDIYTKVMYHHVLRYSADNYQPKLYKTYDEPAIAPIWCLSHVDDKCRRHYARQKPGIETKNTVDQKDTEMSRYILFSKL